MVTLDATVKIKKESFRERIGRADKLTAGFIFFAYAFFGLFLILPVVLILFASLQNSLELESRTDILNVILIIVSAFYIIIPYIIYHFFYYIGSIISRTIVDYYYLSFIRIFSINNVFYRILYNFFFVVSR